MKIKITGCSDPQMWYRDKIDHKFEVLDYTFDVYIVRICNEKFGNVKFEDAEII